MPLEQLELDDLEAVVQLNLYAPLLLMQVVAPLMRARRWRRNRQRQLRHGGAWPSRVLVATCPPRAR